MPSMAAHSCRLTSFSSRSFSERHSRFEIQYTRKARHRSPFSPIRSTIPYEMTNRLPLAFTPSSTFLPSTSLNRKTLLTSTRDNGPPRPHRPALSMSTSFRKYHGLGNDFVLVDNRATSTPVLTPSQSSTLCDRHRGIGADGVIFLLPPTQPTSDCSMRLYNADGSEPEMCGNGIRCLAKFAVDLGVHAKHDGKYIVDTGAGVIIPQLVAGMVCVDMGVPILEPDQIPTRLRMEEGLGWQDTMHVNGTAWDVTSVSMGNPHAVIFVSEDEFVDLNKRLEQVGPLFESHEMFPARTNTEFVLKRGERDLEMLVWERGSGRTMACGTGACAVVAAAVLRGICAMDEDVRVRLPGGDLNIRWVRETGKVLMTGPAEFVFEGKVDV